MSSGRISSSYKDPSGFVFLRRGSLFRQVNKIYKDDYEKLVNSGLLKELVDSNLIIGHKDVSLKYAVSDRAFKILKPATVLFISYPYEWCFGQIRDAALVTLKIQKKALEFGMTLKDASAFNIQFVRGKPVLIDSLSFEIYRKGQTWVAYRQFCEHFLAPLALMRYRDLSFNRFLRIYLDGLSLQLTSSLLPLRSYLNFSLLTHVHLHARSKTYFADKAIRIDKSKMSKRSLVALIDHLEKAVRSLSFKQQKTEWSSYYSELSYSRGGFSQKKKIIENFLKKSKPKVVWDLGANKGVFSRITSEKGILTVAFDIDPVAVEGNYQEMVKKSEDNILPLLMDLTNPSPDIGWASEERASLVERGPADTVLFLAMIHHLAISHNLPFREIARFLSKICKFLIIEFVPKSDSQMKRLLSSRKDIFSNYKRSEFEEVFADFFKVRESVELKDSGRVLYLLEKRKGGS